MADYNDNHKKYRQEVLAVLRQNGYTDNDSIFNADMDDDNRRREFYNYLQGEGLTDDFNTFSANIGKTTDANKPKVVNGQGFLGKMAADAKGAIKSAQGQIAQYNATKPATNIAPEPQKPTVNNTPTVERSTVENNPQDNQEWLDNLKTQAGDFVNAAVKEPINAVGGYVKDMTKYTKEPPLSYASGERIYEVENRDWIGTKNPNIPYVQLVKDKNSDDTYYIDRQTGERLADSARMPEVKSETWNLKDAFVDKTFTQQADEELKKQYGDNYLSRTDFVDANHNPIAGQDVLDALAEQKMTHFYYNIFGDDGQGGGGMFNENTMNFLNNLVSDAEKSENERSTTAAKEHFKNNPVYNYYPQPTEETYFNPEKFEEQISLGKSNLFTEAMIYAEKIEKECGIKKDFALNKMCEIINGVVDSKVYEVYNKRYGVHSDAEFIGIGALENTMLGKLALHNAPESAKNIRKDFMAEYAKNAGNLANLAQFGLTLLGDAPMFAGFGTIAGQTSKYTMAAIGEIFPKLPSATKVIRHLMTKGLSREAAANTYKAIYATSLCTRLSANVGEKLLSSGLTLGQFEGWGSVLDGGNFFTGKSVVGEDGKETTEGGFLSGLKTGAVFGTFHHVASALTYGLEGSARVLGYAGSIMGEAAVLTGMDEIDAYISGQKNLKDFLFDTVKNIPKVFVMRYSNGEIGKNILKLRENIKNGFRDVSPLELNADNYSELVENGHDITKLYVEPENTRFNRQDVSGIKNGEKAAEILDNRDEYEKQFKAILNDPHVSIETKHKIEYLFGGKMTLSNPYEMRSETTTTNDGRFKVTTYNGKDECVSVRYFADANSAREFTAKLDKKFEVDKINANIAKTIVADIISRGKATEKELTDMFSGGIRDRKGNIDEKRTKELAEEIQETTNRLVNGSAPYRHMRKQLDSSVEVNAEEVTPQDATAPNTSATTDVNDSPIVINTDSNTIKTPEGRSVPITDGVNELESSELSHVHDDGTIHTAVMRDGSEVHVVEGDIALDPTTGAIDEAASSDKIVYVGADGKPHIAAPKDFDSVLEPITVRDYLNSKAAEQGQVTEQTPATGAYVKPLEEGASYDAIYNGNNSTIVIDSNNNDGTFNATIEDLTTGEEYTLTNVNEDELRSYLGADMQERVPEEENNPPQDNQEQISQLTEQYNGVEFIDEDGETFKFVGADVDEDGAYLKFESEDNEWSIHVDDKEDMDTLQKNLYLTDARKSIYEAKAKQEADIAAQTDAIINKQKQEQAQRQAALNRQREQEAKQRQRIADAKNGITANDAATQEQIAEQQKSIEANAPANRFDAMAQFRGGDRAKAAADVDATITSLIKKQKKHLDKLDAPIDYSDPDAMAKLMEEKKKADAYQEQIDYWNSVKNVYTQEQDAKKAKMKAEIAAKEESDRKAAEEAAAKRKAEKEAETAAAQAAHAKAILLPNGSPVNERYENELHKRGTVDDAIRYLNTRYNLQGVNEIINKHLDSMNPNEFNFWKEVSREQERITTPRDAADIINISNQSATPATEAEVAELIESGEISPVALAGKYLSAGNWNKESVLSETGFGAGDLKGFVGMYVNEGGKTINRMAHDLYEGYPNIYPTDLDAKNAIIEALNSSRTKGDLNKMANDEAVAKRPDTSGEDISAENYRQQDIASKLGYDNYNDFVADEENAIPSYIQTMANVDEKELSQLIADSLEQLNKQYENNDNRAIKEGNNVLPTEQADNTSGNENDAAEGTSGTMPVQNAEAPRAAEEGRGSNQPQSEIDIDEANRNRFEDLGNRILEIDQRLFDIEDELEYADVSGRRNELVAEREALMQELEDASAEYLGLKGVVVKGVEPYTVDWYENKGKGFKWLEGYSGGLNDAESVDMQTAKELREWLDVYEEYGDNGLRDYLFNETRNEDELKDVYEGHVQAVKDKLESLTRKEKETADESAKQPEENIPTRDFSNAKSAIDKAKKKYGKKNADLSKNKTKKLHYTEENVNFAKEPDKQQKWIEDNLDTLIQDYLDSLAKRETGKNVFDPDEVRKLLAPIGYDGNDVASFKEKAEILNEAILDKMLERAVDKGNGTLTLMSGLPGSGKSFAAKTHSERLKLESRGVVVDRPFNSLNSIKELYDKAKAAGITDIRMVAVYCDPVKNVSHIISRGKNTGRWTPIDYWKGCFDKQIGKLAKVMELMPDIQISAIENTADGQCIFHEDANNSLYWSFELSEEQKEQISKILYDDETIPEQFKEATEGVIPRISQKILGADGQGVSGESQANSGGVRQKVRNVERKGYTLEKRKHTKTGEDLYAVNFEERMSASDFKEAKKKAKELGGYYSSFKSNSGFLFPTEEAAERFARTIQGKQTVKDSMINAAQKEVASIMDNKEAPVRPEIELIAEPTADVQNNEIPKDPLLTEVVDKEYEEYLPGERITLKDGTQGTVAFVVHKGEQVGATSFSKPRVERYYLANGKRVNPDDVKGRYEAPKNNSDPLAEIVEGEPKGYAAEIEKQGAKNSENAGKQDSFTTEEEKPKTKNNKKADFSGNKIFTQDRYESALERLRKKLNQLNAGIDPELLEIGIEIAGAHIEKGVRNFKDFVLSLKETLGDLFEGFKPHIKTAYMGLMGSDSVPVEWLDEMDDARTVKKADIDVILKEANKPITVKPIKEIEYKKGDKVIYKGKEATVYAVNEDGRGKITLDTGLAPVLYEMVEPTDVTKPTSKPSGRADANPIAQVKKTVERIEKRQNAKKQVVNDVPDLFDLFADEQIKSEGERQIIPEKSISDKENNKDVAEETEKDVTLQQETTNPNLENYENVSGRSEVQNGYVREGVGQNAPGNERPRINGSSASNLVPDSIGSGRSDRFSEGEQEPLNQNNYRGKRGKDYAPTTPAARVDANIEAIQIMKQLIANGKMATKAQKDKLRLYTGWGGLGGFFESKRNSNNSSWWWTGTVANRERAEQISRLMTDDEYAAAVQSINSAYFTPAYVVDAMWDVAQALGVNGGNILEGSAGVGNMFAQMPEHIHNSSSLHGVEIDETTGNILKLLYPDAKIDIQGFEKTKIRNNSVDFAITNVPFVTGLHVVDPIDTDLSNKFGNIHDFCIAKNVRKLKQGGIGIFISSSGTMDKSSELRRWLVTEGHADIIDAFRLNNETFGGTSATSDIIVVRKRINDKKGPLAIEAQLVNTKTGEYEGNYDWRKGKNEVVKCSMSVNEYFVTHPENMAGEMKFGYEEGDTYRPGSAGLYAGKHNQKKEINAWVQRLAARISEAETSGEIVSEQVPINENPIYERTTEKEGKLHLDSNGKLCISQWGESVPLEVNSNKVAGYAKPECFNDYLSIKDAVNKLLETEANSTDDSSIESAMNDLNRAYDKFVNRYGYLNKNTKISFLRNDVDFPSIAALENVSETSQGITITKRDIFTNRVIGLEAEPHPTNIKDGLTTSLFLNNRIDVDYIAGQLGRTPDEVRKEILDGRLGFYNPISGEIEVKHVYLSGNVRQKLKQATLANENHELDANIEELQKAIPMTIPAHLIEFSLGSSWLPVEIFTDYMKDRCGGAYISNMRHLAGGWHGGDTMGYGELNKAFGVYSEICERQIWGTELIHAAMNNKSITVQMRRKIAKDAYETIVDKKATEQCNVRIQEIKDDFAEWARKKMLDDEKLSKKIEDTYNEKFNSIVPLKISEEFLPKKFPNANPRYTPYPHQRSAVVRAMSEPVMLAHEVGSGKTITLITTAMEMRRLGTAKKPMIVVHNATLGQFVSEAKDLYPNAKILTLTEKDKGEVNRRNFYAKIKYGDWDMIIIPQSTLDKIPDSIESQQKFIQKSIEDKLHVLEELKMAKDKSAEQIVKQMELEIENLQSDMSALSGGVPTVGKKKGKKNDAKTDAKATANAAAKAEKQLLRKTDDVGDFESLGVDAILIDEAHNYKHLGFATAMQRGVKGVDPTPSKRAASVYLKTRSILENNGWKNVVFATGTPISNTAGELWTFMKFMLPEDVMKENDIYYFDDFVRNFGKISQMLEHTTSGAFKENNRFAQYFNKPELIRLWAKVSDTVLSKDIKYVSDKIPDIQGGKAEDIFLDQTPSMRSVMKWVLSELARFEAMSGKEKKANSHIPLTMYGIAKRAAIDARLVDTYAKDEPGSKTNQAVANIIEDLKFTNDYKGTVAVFCDNYQRKPSSNNKGFNLFEDMKDKLIASGLKESEIAIVEGGGKWTPEKKAKLFDKLKSGEVRVVFGTTESIGTGSNFQERLHAIYHMDAPQRPMDYTQRNGRGLRQGNLHKEWDKPIRIVRFGVKDSLDVTAYQMLKTKSDFIDSIMDGKGALENNQIDRTVEEVDEGIFDNPVAMLSGSEYAMKKRQAEQEYRKYKRKKEQWEQDQKYVTNQLRTNKGQIKFYESVKAETEDQLDNISKVFPSGVFENITINGKKLTKEEDITKAFSEINKLVQDKADVLKNGVMFEDVIQLNFKVNGVDVVVTVNMEKKRKDLNSDYSIYKAIKYSIADVGIKDNKVKGGYVRGALTDIIENVITGAEAKERYQRAERNIESIERDNEILAAREGKPFEFGDKLGESKKLVDEYTELMRQELEEKHKKYVNIDAQVEEHSVEAEDEDEGIYFRTSDELDEEYPGWRNQSNPKGDKEGGHSTQISSTRKTYQKIGEWLIANNMQDADVLDASSGLGYGTLDMREMGINVEDVEPFQTTKRKNGEADTPPATYESYDEIDKQYDLVISNAVLNVIPDDWRADVLKNMADKVKVGGKMFINCLNNVSVSENTKILGTRPNGKPNEVLTMWDKDHYRSYQRIYSAKELAEYVREQLGEGWDIETAKKAGINSSDAIIVTRNSGDVLRFSDLDAVEKANSHSPQLQPSEEGQANENGNPVAKVVINSYNRKEIEENVANLQKKYAEGTTKEFLQSIRKALLTNSSEHSGYNEQVIDNKKYTLRISDHYANARHNKNNNQLIVDGIVIKIEKGRFRAHKDVKMTERVFFVDNFTDDKRKAIVEAIKEWVNTGKITNLDSDDIHYSPKREMFRNQHPFKSGQVLNLHEGTIPFTHGGYKGFRFDGQQIMHDSKERALDALRDQYPDVAFIEENGKVVATPWSEILKPRKRTKSDVAYSQRTIKYAEKAIDDLAKQMHITDKVELIWDTSNLKGRRAKAKGWFDLKDGKIYIVMPNNRSRTDAVMTLLHEGVSHYGLRELFGDDFDTCLDNIYNNVTDDIRNMIDEKAKKDGDTRKATEELMAEIAETMEHDIKSKNASWMQRAWRVIKDNLIELLRKAGLRLGYKLNDNDLRYILWRSYRNMASKATKLERGNIKEAVKDIAKRDELGIGFVADSGFEPEPTGTDGGGSRTERGERNKFSSSKGGNTKGSLASIKAQHPGTLLFVEGKKSYRIYNEDAKALARTGVTNDESLKTGSDNNGKYVEIPASQFDKVLPMVVHSGNRVAIVQHVDINEDAVRFRDGDDELSKNTPNFVDEKKLSIEELIEKTPLEERRSTSYVNRHGHKTFGLYEIKDKVEEDIRIVKKELANSSARTNDDVQRRLADLVSLGAEIDNVIKKREDDIKKLKADYEVEADGSISLSNVRKLFDDLSKEMPKDDKLSELIEDVFDYVKDYTAQFKIIPFDEKGANTRYEDEIYFSEDWLASGASAYAKASTILHEMIHHMTMNVMGIYRTVALRRYLPKNLRDACADLQHIYNLVKKAKPKGNNGEVMYGAHTVYEMMSEMAKPEFREVLKNIKVDEYTAWEKIVRWVRDLFHLGNKSYGSDKNGLELAEEAMKVLSKNYSYVAEELDRTIGIVIRFPSYVIKGIKKGFRDFKVNTFDESETNSQSYADRMAEAKSIADNAIISLGNTARKFTPESQEEGRKAVKNYIKAALASKNMPEVGKRELNKIMAAVENVKNGRMLRKHLTAAETIVKDAEKNHTLAQINRLLTMKKQGRNNRNVSIAQSVDDRTRQIFNAIRTMTREILNSSVDDDINSATKEISNINKVIETRLRELLKENNEDFETIDSDKPTRLSKERKEELINQYSDEKVEYNGEEYTLAELKDMTNVAEQKREELKFEKAEEAASHRAASASNAQTELDALMAKWQDEDAEFTEEDCIRAEALNILSLLNKAEMLETSIDGINDNGEHSESIASLTKEKARLEAENRQLRNDLHTAHERDKDYIKQQIAANKEAIDNCVTAMNTVKERQIYILHEAQEVMNGLIEEGRSRLKDILQAEHDRKSEIIKNAYDDIKTNKEWYQYDKKGNKIDTSKRKRMASFLHTVFATPLESFVYMSQKISNRLSGTGYIYRRFVEGDEGVVAAHSNHSAAMKRATEMLDSAAQRFMGMNAKKAADKLRSMNDKDCLQVTVNYLDKKGNVAENTYKLSKGTMMYISQLWNMKDGKMKLSAMGFTEDDIQEIRGFLGENLLNFCDWMVETYYPQLKKRVNKVHKDIYHTSMNEVENYVPIRIDKQALNGQSNMVEGASGSYNESLQKKNNSIVNRTVNRMAIDLSRTALDVLAEHTNTNEEWVAYARIRQDLDYLLNSKAFRNQLNANSHGSYNDFENAVRVAVNLPAEPMNPVDGLANILSAGFVSGAISFKLNTALKQLLSFPAFVAYSQHPKFLMSLAKYAFTPYQNYKWAKENMPSFAKRIEDGLAGSSDVERELSALEDGFVKKSLTKYNKLGMLPNKIIDALTCAAGARSVYDFQYRRAKARGAEQEAAHAYAVRQADIAYNETQQSNVGSFKSAAQTTTRSWANRMTTVFQNANLLYTRKALLAMNDIFKRIRNHKRLVAQYAEDFNITQEEAAKEISNKIRKSVVSAALLGIIVKAIWDSGNDIISDALFSLFGYDDDDKKYVPEEEETEMTYIGNAVKYAGYLFQGTIGGNVMHDIPSAGSYNPFSILVQNEAGRVGDAYDKYGISTELATQILTAAGDISGFRMQTWANVYIAAEDLITNGADANAAIDIALILNMPKKTRERLVRKSNKSYSPIEFAKAMALARKLDNRDASMSILLGVSKLSDKKLAEIESEWQTANVGKENMKMFNEAKKQGAVLDKAAKYAKGIKDKSKMKPEEREAFESEYPNLTKVECKQLSNLKKAYDDAKSNAKTYYATGKTDDYERMVIEQGKIITDICDILKGGNVPDAIVERNILKNEKKQLDREKKYSE